MSMRLWVTTMHIGHDNSAGDDAKRYTLGWLRLTWR
jgi:hypothetical protein